MAFDKRKALQNALAFTQQGKWDRAIAEYQAILRADPKDLTVCNNLGDLFARAGKLGDAVEQYLKLGELYRADGLAVKAIAVYKKIIKLDAARVAAYLACADLYMEQGLVGEAKIQLTTAADLFAKAGDTAELIKTYQRLAQLDAGNAALITKLADLLLKTGRTEEAALDYERAAQAAQAAGQAAESKRLLKKARELAPQVVGPSLADAEVLIQAGQFAEAAAGLERLCASEPGNAEAWRLLGEASVAAGRGAEGLAALKQAIALGVGEETLRGPLAAAMVLAGQAGEAVALCERVTEDALNRGEFDEAIAFCRSLLTPETPAIPVRTYLMTLLMNLGRDTEARAEALTLGALHEAAGDAEAAARLYEQLLIRDPDDAEARSRLEAVLPGSAGGPAAAELSLSAGAQAETAAQPAEAPVVAASEPEIALEGLDDLAALLGEPPAEPGEPEEPAFETFGAAAFELPADQGGVTAEPTIAFSMPGEEGPLALESLPPAEEPAFEPDAASAAAAAEAATPDSDLGEFAALLQEPDEEPVPVLELESPTESLAALAAAAAAESEAPDAAAFGGPAVIELAPLDEPIAFAAVQAEGAPEPETLGAADLSPGAFLALDAEAPPEPPPGPAAAVPDARAPEPPASAAPEIVAAEDDGSQQVAEQMAEADVYLKYGLEDKARERIAEAIRLAPRALQPRQRLKEICLERGQAAEACEQIAVIADLLVSRRQSQDAVEALRQGLALVPDHPDLRRRLAALGGPSVLAAPPAPGPAEPPEPSEILPATEDAGPGPEFLDVAPPPGEAGEVHRQAADAPGAMPPEEWGAALPEMPAEPLEMLAPGEAVDFGEESAVADAAEPAVGETADAFPPLGEAAAESWPPDSAAWSAAETVAIPRPEEAASLAATLFEVPPAEEAAVRPVDALAETVVVPTAESSPAAEIPTELRALLEGPDATPILVEAESPERDQLLADDLAEAEFYLAQGMLDEARAVHRRLLAQRPGHPAVADLGAKLAPSASTPSPAAGGPAPVETAPAPPVSLQDVIPTFTVADGRTAAGSELPGGGFVDLGAELAEELEAEDRTAAAGRDDTTVESVLQVFQRGVREQISDADYETHYNLGVAYKDMELIDEAIEEFRMASRGMERALECADLLGQCYLAKGKPDEAVRCLRTGLEVPGHPREAYHGIRYTLSLAYDAQGDVARALEQLEVVQGEDPRFRDVAARIQLLRARMVPRPDARPEAAPAPPPGPKSKKKISFI